jgi:hypothetical protein
MKRLQLLKTLFLVVFIPSALLAQDFNRVKDLTAIPGFLTTYYDESEDRLFMKVDRLEEELLYVTALSSGVGSNDIGLDRGQLGSTKVVYFKKAGNKLLLIEPNQDYRALSENALEKASVNQAFAKSVIAGFTILETANDGSFLIDLNPLLLRDAHGVIDRLSATQQGNYQLDLSRSAHHRERSKSFEKNILIDVLLTFSGKPKGYEIRSVAPDASLVSVTQMHSFIELPELGGFEMRSFDARSGAYPFRFFDYAAPVNGGTAKDFIRRHRLVKKDPNAAVSEAVEPIVYYLDNGTPEPVRTALLEGGRWWNQAFEAIGYKDAFQVKMLPDDADPLDIRYNVIQWVHRSTRGWSYGSSVTDPRTGEILKGHVSLGSLRIRQDYLIAQGLYNQPYNKLSIHEQTMLDMALNRIRQLSAHEIGHTLGFAHNFAASTNDRASVMDYPHPLVLEGTGDQFDFSEAYDKGIGDWDKVTVAYAYSDFGDGVDENQALQEILENAEKVGLKYLTDSDARPAGSASATAHLWDNGTDITEELYRLLDLRAKAISRFSLDNVPEHSPVALLEDVFVPLYFSHRYQTEAVSKLIGGIDYSYAYTDATAFHHPVSRKEQEKALKALIRTLDPETLEIPKYLRSVFGPRTFGYGRTRESFESKLGVAFDPLAAAETAASTTLKFMLHPERANRIYQQGLFDKNQLTLQEMIKLLLDETVRSMNSKDPYYNAIEEIVAWQTLDELMKLSSSDKVYPQVTEVILLEMMRLKTHLENSATDPTAIYLRKQVERFIGNPTGYKSEESSVRIPDGSPIGQEVMCNFSWN